MDIMVVDPKLWKLFFIINHQTSANGIEGTVIISYLQVSTRVETNHLKGHDRSNHRIGLVSSFIELKGLSNAWTVFIREVLNPEIELVMEWMVKSFEHSRPSRIIDWKQPPESRVEG
ncbi:hypothetical protein OH492_20785 [Vibrio chagasii]|nr:hypothetical protein [Vibrio chagasii]